jgi:undecaprenyl pyrophosphate phosphatase UppP
MKLFCSNTSKAGMRYAAHFAVVMVFYSLAVRYTGSIASHSQPHGWKLYLLASLPTIPIICMLVVVGLYLREETDEYKRVVLVRSVLIATAVTLAYSVFNAFLSNYGGSSPLSPFMPFVVFWVVTGVVQGIQSIVDRVGSNEE